MAPKASLGHSPPETATSLAFENGGTVFQRQGCTSSSVKPRFRCHELECNGAHGGFVFNVQMADAILMLFQATQMGGPEQFPPMTLVWRPIHVE